MCSRLDTPKSLVTPRDRSKFQHNDPTGIKHCQNVRITSAKLLVKFQLDCCKIKANFPWACIHGFGSTRLAVFWDGQKTPSTYGSSFPRPSQNTASQVDPKPWIHAQGKFALILQQSSWNFTGSFALVRRTFWQCLMTVGSLCRDLERSRGVSRDFGVSRREHMLSWNVL